MAVIPGLLPVGREPNLHLDTTVVTNENGDQGHREGVFIGDPAAAIARASVMRSAPGVGDYGLTVRPLLNVDAFGRLRVSDPVTVFDSQHQYRVETLIWDATTLCSGTGVVTHIANESAAQLSTGGTASGAKAVLQSRTYHRYQPGKSHLILVTGTLGTATTNLRRRIGYFDANNGIFFEQTSTGVSIVKRSYATGSAVDTPVAQADWNIDPMDGTGPSGVTVDWTKSQIFLADLEWLGVGTVRVGLVVNGCICYVHAFHNANNGVTVYMTTANLPVRIEIENTGATAATNTMLHICASVMSEGGFENERSYKFTGGNGITSIGVTTRRPICSIRPATTFNSIAFRGQVIPEQIDITAATNNSYFELVVNGALTGATWATTPTNSAVQVDIAANAIAGGTVVGSGYVLAGSGATRGYAIENIVGRIALGLDAIGTTPDVFSVVCTAFTGTSNVTASMQWRELR